MDALVNSWRKAALLSEDDRLEDRLIDFDPVAYEQLIAKKARKREEAEDLAFERHRIEVKIKEQQREDAARKDEAIRAAQWDRTMTEYGGRQISQAEAQDVRAYIAAHRTDVVAYGLEHGHFRTEAEGNRFVDNEARLHELNEADRAGWLTAAQRDERARLEQEQRPYSDLRGHLLDVMSAGKAPQLSESARQPAAEASNPDSLFRARAPDMKGSFDRRTASEPLQNLPAPPTADPKPVAASSLAMSGLS